MDNDDTDADELERQRRWIGKSRTDHDALSVRQARLMAATIGSARPFEAGAPLPALWHWIYFLEGLPPDQLGPDGHAARGGFLPPVPSSNRMWAGGQLTFHEAVPLGAQATKESRIASVEHKTGRSGPLTFVTVEHRLSVNGRLAITELHDIVYKQPRPSAPAAQQQAPREPEMSRTFTPDAVCLFRYSALTFNGHRIHYDADYARKCEGYANLVVHGPLIATMLAGFAEDMTKTGQRLTRFRYRAVQPTMLGQTLTLNAVHAMDGLELWASLPGQNLAMTAQATFAPAAA